MHFCVIFSFKSETNPLLAGIPQEVTMNLFTGFYTMKADDKLCINTPSDVQILDAETDEFNIKSEGMRLDEDKHFNNSIQKKRKNDLYFLSKLR